MSHRDYTIQMDKACPRCGSKEALVSVLWMGTCHQPRCKSCGLNDGGGDSEAQAKPILTNCYYEWEEKHGSTTSKPIVKENQ